ncbi:MAG: hypothetical protein QOC91_475 [Solirubrobacteraceae bacterium]|jgi:hypothetical protein|nr:hypothetical protein [Solirubrobacteraceae bacterium]
MFGKGKKQSQARPPETGVASELGQDAQSRGGEGARNAEVTPKLASAANPGQTSHPAPPEDVGVPADEKLGREEGSAP